MTHWRDVKITDEMLLDVKCDDCGQPRGVWCVYMPPTSASYVHSPRVKELVARVGTPVKKCHNARYARARHNIHMSWARDRPVTMPPSPEVLDSLRGAQEFERRERVQLRAWLSAHVSLLLNAADVPDEVAP